MLRVTFRSLWSHKRRLISTIVAVLLGVAFMAGTFVLTDTIDQSFDDTFADINQNLDAQVQGEVLFSSPFGDERANIDEALVDTVAGIDGVSAAVPYLGLFGQGPLNRVLGADGEPIGTFGPPTLFENWLGGSELSPYDLVEGNGPEADGQMVLNVGAAEDGDLAIGDDVTLLTQFGREQFELVGLVQVNGEDSLAGAVGAGMTMADVQRLAGLEGQIQQVLVDAEDGISQEDITARVAEVLPESAEVITGEQATADLSAQVQEGFSFITIALSVFGGLALLVGVFVISNTFSILVAQRTRELALLRSIGASRRQVMTSVLLEATAIGLVAAALGLAAGIGLATLAFGIFDLPGSLLIKPGTAISALVIGVVVALIAAITPAVRATRVPPLAALRDVAVESTRVSKIRVALGVILAVVGVLLAAQAWMGDENDNVLPAVGVGAVAIIVASIVMGPVLAGRSIRILGSGLPRLKGVTGRLAVENAARSPKRTSATSAALLIGVALVSFITVFGASARKTTDVELDRGFRGDFVVQGEGGFAGGFSGFSPAVADSVAEVDGVETVVAFGFGGGQVEYPDGETSEVFVGGVDPGAVADVLEPRMTEGTVDDLTDEGIILDNRYMEDHELSVGDSITLTVSGGAQVDLVIEAVSDDELTLGTHTVSRSTYNSLVPQATDIQLFGSVADGADVDAVLADIETALDANPGLEVLDQEGFKGAIAESINQILTMVLVLLFISILIAAIGIANTLSLSINERVRELGLLRAVGMDRKRLKSTIRWEAVMISVLGSVVGLVIGIGVSWVVIEALSREGLSQFEVPIPTMIVIVVLAALLGVVASILPARRAARMAILDAIAMD